MTAMTKKDSNIKGDYLEDAVQQIQTVILKTNPNLQGSKFTIERKKLIFPGGVKREIDLYVKVDPGNDLESVFVFECKNWNKPVDANSITVFSTKIDETNATRGFFVAKKFSENSRKEAKKDERILLLEASDDFIDTEIFPNTHMIYEDASKRKIEIQMEQRGSKGKKTKIKKIQLDKVFFEEEEISANDFFLPICQNMINDRMNKEPTQTLTEGIYFYEEVQELRYKTKQLIINSLDIEKIILTVNFEQQLIKPVIVSKFDIEKKGYYLNQELKLPNGGNVSLGFVALK